MHFSYFSSTHSPQGRDTGLRARRAARPPCASPAQASAARQRPPRGVRPSRRAAPNGLRARRAARPPCATAGGLGESPRTRGTSAGRGYAASMRRDLRGWGIRREQLQRRRRNDVVCCFGCLPAACLMKCVGKQCYTEMKVAIAFT